MIRFRHQLPAYSPVSGRAALFAASHALRLRDDPRPQLIELLKREYDAKDVLLCGSGTQALSIAIEEAHRRAEPDSTVALPAFSCFDVATAAVGAHVCVSFYDVDPATLGPDFASVRRALVAGARVVVVAPLFGLPVDWSQLSTLTKSFGAVLIEDAAQGHGAEWHSRRLGAFGELTTLSFGRGKGWTGGRGGALLTRAASEPINRSLPQAGFMRESATSIAVGAQWALARPELYAIPRAMPGLRLGDTVYHDPATATSLTRAAAEVILSTYGSAQLEAEARRTNAARLLVSISDLPGLRTIPELRGGQPGYLRLPLRLSRGIAALGSRSQASALGIAPSYATALPDLRRLGSIVVPREEKLLGARTLVRELVTLPTHSRLSGRDVAQIVEMLKRIS